MEANLHCEVEITILASVSLKRTCRALIQVKLRIITTIFPLNI